MRCCTFIFILLYPFFLLSQDSSSVSSYKNRDFVEKKENRVWSLDVVYILPIGKTAGFVNTNTAVYGYFYNYSTKKVSPVHYTNGFGIRVSKKCISARTFNGKLAYGKIISPLFVDFIQYDFKGDGSEPRINSSSLKPIVRFGPEGGIVMSYKLNSHAEIQACLLSSLFGETFNGKMKFEHPFQYSGNTVAEVDYSFSGIGTLVNEGIGLRFYKLVLGIENYSTISYGKYFIRHKFLYNGQIQGGASYDLNSVFKTQQIRFILSYVF